MRMLLEEPSLIEVAPHRHTPASGIVRYARACAILIAGVIGTEKVQGEDIFANTHADIQASLLHLEDADFEARADAEERIGDALQAALNIQNPLPQKMLNVVSQTTKQHPSPEIRARIDHILRATEHKMQEQPGRILSSEQLNLPLSTILEQQFNLSIRIEDPTMENALRTYRGGENGQTSTEALKELCDQLCCVPIFFMNSIMLTPIKEGDRIEVSDEVIRTTLYSPPYERVSTILAPDKGVILFSRRSLICWKKLKPHLPESYLPDNLPIKTNRLLIASHPETLLLDLHEQKPAYSANVTLGAQPSELTLQPSLRKVIQYKNVTYYSTTIQGHARMDIDPLVQQEIDFSKLDCLANVASSEAMRHARIIAFDEHGKEIPVSILDLQQCEGDFSIEIMSEVPIQKLSITIYTSIDEKTIQMP